MTFFRNLDDVNANSECLFSLADVEKNLDITIRQITAELQDSRPVVIGVMRGALAMMGHILPRLPFYLEVDYVHASRYQNQLQPGELMWVHEPHIPLAGRSVLLVDDILDQGITLQAIAEKCHALGASEVKIAVLCKKIIAGFEPAIAADYIAMTVPDAYVFGYGMDCEGGWRNAPGIYKLKS
ncbi:MAG TPA: hypoxanthine-guanine phosphoribosyltransferase [Cellvibrio sp.]|nr:hypoxanthine-guanine phosphoribosyltransferase [Cellvibrio sp.]